MLSHQKIVIFTAIKITVLSIGVLAYWKKDYYNTENVAIEIAQVNRRTQIYKTIRNNVLDFKLLPILAILNAFDGKSVLHHDNTSVWLIPPRTPLLYIKLGFKGVNFSFHSFFQTIDCGYSLEPPQ